MITRIPFDQYGYPFLEIETEQPNLSLIERLPENGLAIIGTREPQFKSFELLEMTLKELTHSGLTIVSGFARGIDSKAHELAIENGLKTIAILGCGLHTDYPRENRHLRKKIIQSGGMMISPYDREAPALPHHFLERNQLIAHFSKAVWVVEASAISGTLNTANHASQMNRDLYATACFPTDPYFEGNRKILSRFETNRYPLAEPFFGSKSLENTWNHLNLSLPKEKTIRRGSLSRIQKWILSLQEAQGECRIHSLMTHALNQGVSAKEFYHDYEEELKKGKIRENLQGKVELG